MKDRFSGALGYISGTKSDNLEEGGPENLREESPPPPPELPSFAKISAMSLDELGTRNSSNPDF